MKDQNAQIVKHLIQVTFVYKVKDVTFVNSQNHTVGNEEKTNL